ncbi:NACHT domain-containing protein [Mastigocladus laminosus UU774]|nr:NACHT domain-containing protein [Mastigocladus laminosus UU774]
MALQNWRRKRGVALTTKGLQKLQEAKRGSEAQENFGNSYTLEEMSALTGLYPSTISKVLNRESGVDKKTLEKLFTVFKVKLEKSDYISSNSRIDWGHATIPTVFYGRTQEVATLEQWILNERCRFVAVLGMGGIGKTSLSIKLAQQIQEEFEYVIWRSLREAPPVKSVLVNLIQFLSDEQETETNLPENLAEIISRLIDYLRNNRCLVILDNIESILSSGNRSGHYAEGYEGYGQLFQQLGEAAHTSCLVLTSREKPKEVALMEGRSLPVHSLLLTGLNVEEGQEILKVKGLSATDKECKRMIDLYAGNPLALKIIATTIQDIFGGNVTQFLEQDAAVFGDIRDVLDQQFARLSNLEKEIMYWLAINREPVSLSDLREDILSPTPPKKLLEALESLVRRSLIDQSAATFTLQPVVMEYVTQVLIEQLCEEITTENFDLFRCHALMKATTKDYIKETQIRLIIQPLINELLTVFRSKKGIEKQLTQILARLREELPQEPGYSAGNILNLFSQLQTDLSGYDFSNLAVWQADLRSVNLHNVNFAHADLAKCVFAETLGGIHSVAFSPDGKLLAMGDTDNQVHIYQVADGKQQLVCTGHTDWVWSVSFSPDGKVLASGGKDQTIKLWDVNTGDCLATLQGHSSGISSVAFAPKGNTIASASEDQTVKLWDAHTGKCLKSLLGNNSRVLSIAFSPNGQTLASGYQDQTVKLWDVSTGKCLKTLQGHYGGVWSVSFSPDGQTLASGSHDRTVRLWNLEIGQHVNILHGHTDCINSVVFSLDGHTLASAGDDQTVKLWDVNTGECLRTLLGHASRLWSVAWNPDNHILASAGDDQTLKLWDIATGKCLKTLQGYSSGIWAVAFSANGHMLVSGSGNKMVKLWDANTGQCLKTLRGHSNRVTSVALNANSHILASGSEDQSVKLWDLSSGECLKTLRGHNNWVTSVAISANSQFLASSSDDQTARLWDVKTDNCIHVLEGHADRMWAIAFSPDDQMVATGSHDATIKIWNIITGQCIQTLQGHNNWIWCVTYSPDSLILASANSDQTIKLWNVKTGECIQTLKGHTSSVYSVAFSPDGSMLASGSQDQTVKLWDLLTNQCIQTLEGHTQLIWSVAFSPNGQTLASGSQDDTIKIWDVNSGECIKTLRNERPYEGTNINGIQGITQAQKISLKALGAVAYAED